MQERSDTAPLSEQLRALGIELSEHGRFEEAATCYREVLILAPQDGLTHRLLSELEDELTLSAHIVQMRGLARGQRVGDEARTELEFALGAALERLGEYGDAYAHFERGNALRRKRISYDSARERAFFGHLRAAFNPTIARLCSGLGCSDARPVFVLGMPRSGTTLVESLLAAHPQVRALGELTAFETAIGKFSPVSADPADHVRFLAELRTQFRVVGEEYIAAVDQDAGTGHKFVDKMPANFRFAVPIHLALPSAKIIHVRRDMLDTCFSCYAVNFTQTQDFTFDVRELVEYYAMYEEHMSYVRTILPANVLLEIDYEDVIDDTEAAARTILAHCDLEWDEAVLSYWEVPRRVRTASVHQVRRPVYATSIGRARRFPAFCQAVAHM